MHAAGDDEPQDKIAHGHQEQDGPPPQDRLVGLTTLPLPRRSRLHHPVAFIPRSVVTRTYHHGEVSIFMPSTRSVKRFRVTPRSERPARVVPQGRQSCQQRAMTRTQARRGSYRPASPAPASPRAADRRADRISDLATSGRWRRLDCCAEAWCPGGSASDYSRSVHRLVRLRPAA